MIKVVLAGERRVVGASTAAGSRERAAVTSIANSIIVGGRQRRRVGLDGRRFLSRRVGRVGVSWVVGRWKWRWVDRGWWFWWSWGVGSLSNTKEWEDDGMEAFLLERFLRAFLQRFLLVLGRRDWRVRLMAL